MNTKTYAIASGLRGFRTSELRVRVREIRDGVAFVVTADLADSGTMLVLDPAQLRVEPQTTTVVSHRTGLVTFEV
jgi:hypothetical protein